jgi:hypothetical protein
VADSRRGRYLVQVIKLLEELIEVYRNNDLPQRS